MEGGEQNLFDTIDRRFDVSVYSTETSGTISNATVPVNTLFFFASSKVLARPHCEDCRGFMDVEA